MHHYIFVYMVTKCNMHNLSAFVQELCIMEQMYRVTDSAFFLYTNPSQATIPLIRPHQCDYEGGRIRGVLLY